MKIITERSVEVKSSACGCSSIDGSDNSKVREFQVWASMNHSAQLVADGVYGPLTKKAYATWGQEWEQAQPVKKPIIKNSAPVKDVTEVVAVKKEEVPVKMSFIDKIKAIPLSAKIGIGVGLTTILAIVIWKLIRKK